MTAAPTAEWSTRSIQAVTLAAALVLVVWYTSPANRYLDHARPDHPAGVAMVAVFAAAWMLMVLATMLPTSRPLVEVFSAVVSRRSDRQLLLAALVAGYLAVWLASGVLIGVADLGLHGLVEGGPLDGRRGVVTGATLLLAGAYQVGDTSQACLRGCRNPAGFVHRHWRRSDRATTQAAAIGLDYGLSCFGCCIALMIVMAAVGMSNPIWMIGLAGVAALQKRASWGEQLGRWTGALLIVSGAAVCAATLQLVPGT